MHLLCHLIWTKINCITLKICFLGICEVRVTQCLAICGVLWRSLFVLFLSVVLRLPLRLSLLHGICEVRAAQCVVTCGVLWRSLFVLFLSVVLRLPLRWSMLHGICEVRVVQCLVTCGVFWWSLFAHCLSVVVFSVLRFTAPDFLLWYFLAFHMYW